MRTEAGKMPESLIFLTENSPGVSNDRFGFIGYENGMMVFKARAWGVAQKIEEDSIYLEAKLLQNTPDIRNESLEFTDGDDILYS